MRIKLCDDPGRFSHLPRFENHWASFKETYGADFEAHVYGVEHRHGRKLFLLLPQPEVLWDVLYSDAVQFDVIDPTVPDEWGVDQTALTDLGDQPRPPDGFWGYPIFSSTPDFVWRLSEADLSDREKASIIELVARCHYR